MIVRMLCNYGKLRTNHWYRVQGEGHDWYRLAGICVPKDFVTTDKPPVRRRRRERPRRSKPAAPQWD